jgi:integration host factor subunit beta
MTKSDLIEAVAGRLKLPKGKAELVVNCVFESMVDSLKRNEGIEIRGFGSFTVRQYKAYEGRNPRTGEPVHVKPKRLPFFKVGKDLRERVNNYPAERGGDGKPVARPPGRPAAQPPHGRQPTPAPGPAGARNPSSGEASTPVPSASNPINPSDPHSR